MTLDPPRLIALVAHARRVPIAERQQFARRLAEHGRTTALILETCHRVESYFTMTEDADHAALEAMLPAGGELLVGDRAARHAIAVAIGLDSVVVGEDQILHQLRASMAAARRDGRLDPTVERLFTHALRSGRRARSWRQGRAMSLADLALAVIERRVGAVRGRAVLVVGSGEMGRLAAAAAAAAGATVSVSSRTAGNAHALARTIGGRSVPFDPGTAISDVAGAIVALRGPWAIGPSTVELMAAGSAVVVDLSTPPAVSSDVSVRLQSRYVSADTLASASAAASLGVGHEPSRLEELVEATLAEFVGWLAGRSERAVAQALADRAEEERRAALDELWRRLPALEPEARDAVEAMSRHLARRLLRDPFERLGRDPREPAEQAARELFAL